MPVLNAARPESAPYRGAKDQWDASITVGRALRARRFNKERKYGYQGNQGAGRRAFGR